MESITIRIPEEHFNRLNNFYIDNFNYDIYTEIQNFLVKELKRCEGYSTEKPEKYPKPSITKVNSPTHKREFQLIIYYPDGSTLQLYHDDYQLLMKIWNEWSKYGFDKMAKEKVLIKHLPERIRNINQDNGCYKVTKNKNGKNYVFGSYDKFEDALKAKQFLEEHDWDFKYHHRNYRDRFEGCTLLNYSDYLMKIIDGELEL